MTLKAFLLPSIIMLVVSGCATLPPVSTLGFAEGDQFMLNQPYKYTIGKTRSTLTIPEGFVFDYASIPGPFRGIFERQGRYSRAALVHDYLYATGICSREQADNIFLIAMKESKVPILTRGAVYGAVRFGGEGAWDGNATDRAANRPRIVPKDRWPLAAGDWSDARRILIRAGQVDPRPSISKTFCDAGNSTDIPGLH